MEVYSEVRNNAYFDSVTLMLFSSRLKQTQGVEEAAVMMGTDHNKRLMMESGVLDEKTAKESGANDLLIGVRAKEAQAVEAAKSLLTSLFEKKKNDGAAQEDFVAKTFSAAVNRLGRPNMAIISLPGKYAKREAMKALKQGMHVLLFSDNVSVDEENELKTCAAQHGLLLMGPECGTAIINGTALGFANVVRRGTVGVVAASGTGLQEVTVLVDRLGGGISQAIGTGGRDVKAAIGGKTMLSALEALNSDDATKVIGIISKSPAETVLQAVTEKAAACRKPIVACFLGAAPGWTRGSNILEAQTLEQAAVMLAALERGETSQGYETLIVPSHGAVAHGRNYVRGLYSGGTLCAESLLILEGALGEVRSNIAADPHRTLQDVEQSEGHTLVDMGDEYFTDGMPHPMIDPRLRSERIIREMADPQTAVLLLDCVLGYGCHEDPASALVDAIEKGRTAGVDGGPLIVASVCGTDFDAQNRSEQERKLRGAGVIVAMCNAQAAKIAVRLIKE